MEEDLVGYLLKTLEPETLQELEVHLQTHPELRSRMDLLERALAPLGADAVDPEPPPALVLSTLARIAEHQCYKLPPAPPPPRQQVGAPHRRWFRWADALVAALILILLGGLGTSSLLHLWRDYHDRTACQNNMSMVWKGLQQYCSTHDGNFPRVEEQGPRGVAGIFVPILHDAQMLGPQVSVTCPAQGREPPTSRSVQELEELFDNHPEEFAREVRKIAGTYAYSLGYRENDIHHNLRCDTGDHLPIMADRLESPSQHNSPNHGGAGQNVLYLGGWVIWCTSRKVGVDNDDIYVNRNNEVHAGVDRDDTVLGPSDAKPGE
jgi:hypothetical protein